jgi:UDP-N-acetylglucosamine:LPS N-acetylglucosamine transferase
MYKTSITFKHKYQINDIIELKNKANEKSVVITYETSDTRTDALDFSIYYFPYVESRKIIPLIRMTPAVFRIARANRFAYVASTGASIAIIGYLLSRLQRIPFYYVEDFNRQSSLSLTARILKRIGLKKIFVQSLSLVSSSNLYLEHPINRYVVTKSRQPK